MTGIHVILKTNLKSYLQGEIHAIQKYSKEILLKFSKKNARQISTNLNTEHSSGKGIQSTKPSICPRKLYYEKKNTL